MSDLIGMAEIDFEIGNPPYLTLAAAVAVSIALIIGVFLLRSILRERRRRKGP